MCLRNAAAAEPIASSLVRLALAHGVPEDLAREAAGVTLRKLSGERAPHARLRAYFWGVVRRRVLSGAPGTLELRTRLVLRSAADDLLDAGYGAELLYEELVARFAGSVDSTLLDEYRPQPIPLAS